MRVVGLGMRLLQEPHDHQMLASKACGVGGRLIPRPSVGPTRVVDRGLAAVRCVSGAWNMSSTRTP